MLFFIRHLERTENPSFETSLTEKGLQDAKQLLINTRSLPMVFCSPFKRCIQTMLPYCKNRNIPLYIDYRLYEYVDDPRIKHNKTLQDLPEYKEYCIESNDNMMESTEDKDILISRAFSFMDDIKEHYSNIDVIICSHQSTLNALLGRSLDTPMHYGEIIKQPI